MRNAHVAHSNPTNRSRVRRRSERALLAGYVHELSERHRGDEVGHSLDGERGARQTSPAGGAEGFDR
jgi:hypothetical protein